MSSLRIYHNSTSFFAQTTPIPFFPFTGIDPKHIPKRSSPNCLRVCFSGNSGREQIQGDSLTKVTASVTKCVWLLKFHRSSPKRLCEGTASQNCPWGGGKEDRSLYLLVPSSLLLAKVCPIGQKILCTLSHSATTGDHGGSWILLLFSPAHA